MSRVGLLQKVALSQDLKEMRVRSMQRYRKSIPSRRSRPCKGPKARVCLTLLRREEVSEAGIE